MVKTAAVVFFALRRADEDMSVPFIGEVAHIGDRDVHTFVVAALDKCGKAVMTLFDIDELPVFFAHRSEIADVFRREDLVIIARIATGRKFAGEILFKRCDLRHSFNSPSL